MKISESQDYRPRLLRFNVYESLPQSIVMAYLPNRRRRYTIRAVPEIAPFFRFDFSSTLMTHALLGLTLESRQNLFYVIRLEYMCRSLVNVLWKLTVSSRFTPAFIPLHTTSFPGSIFP